MKIVLLTLAITATAFAWPPKPPKCSEKMPCKEIKCKVAECKYKYKSKYGYCVYTDDEECCYSDKECPEDTECEKYGKGMYYITTYKCEKYECVPKKVPCCPPKAECDCDKLECPKPSKCEKDKMDGKYYITSYYCKDYKCYPKKTPCCPPKAECDCDKLECPNPSKCEKNKKDGKYYITSYYCKYFKCYPKKTPCCPPCPPESDCYKIKKGKWYKYIKDTYTCSAKTNYVCVKNTVKCPKKP